MVWKGCLEDGTPRILDGSVVRITLGSPPFICHVRAICKGTKPTYRGLTNITNYQPWLLATYMSWDDPPSGAIFFWGAGQALYLLVWGGVGLD